MVLLRPTQLTKAGERMLGLTDTSLLGGYDAGGVGAGDQQSIFATAMGRWLNVSEIQGLLTLETTPLSISAHPPTTPPPSGTLILYDRSVTRNYKDDGYQWIKKRNSPKVREDHVKLRVGGRFRVAGCYVHCATTATLHRRAYHLLDPETGTALHPPNAGGSALQRKASLDSGSSMSIAERPPSLVLVHYLDTQVAALHATKLDNRISAESTERPKSPGSRPRGLASNSQAKAAALATLEARQQQQAIETAAAAQMQRVQAMQAAQMAMVGQQQLPPPESLRNAQQLHNLQRQLHRDEAMAGFAAGQQQKKQTTVGNSSKKETQLESSGSKFDDDTMDILWGMVVEEGDGDLESVLKTSSDLGASDNYARVDLAEDGAEEGDDLDMKEGIAAAAASAVSAFEGELYAAAKKTLDNGSGASKGATMAAELAAAVEAAVEQQPEANENEQKMATGNAPAAALPTSTLPAAALPSLQQLETLQRQQQQQMLQLQLQAQMRTEQEALPQMQQLLMEAQKQPPWSAGPSPNQVAIPLGQSNVAQSSVLQQAVTQIGKPAEKEVSKTSTTSDVPMNKKSNTPLQRDPLPAIVDFTPEHALITQEKRKASQKIVLSCSAPLPTIPDEDATIFMWHLLAAFVDTGSAGNNRNDLKIRAVDLSPAKQLNPYTHRCTVPTGATIPGGRFIILVGVKLYSGTNPVCEGVAAGVAVALRSAWQSAASSQSHNTSNRPTLLSSPLDMSSGDAHGNIQILSQLSEDMFVFEGSAASPSATVTKEYPVAETNSGTDRSDDQLPAPVAAMAVATTALPDYPNPSAKAVVEPHSLVLNSNNFLRPDGADLRPGTNSKSSKLADFTQVPGATDFVAAVREATVTAPNHAQAKEPSSQGIRKRRVLERPNIEATQTSGNSALVTASDASQWTRALGESGDTVGVEVDRHCKIRFVEKLSSVIAGAEEGAEPGKVKGDSWSIPSVPGAFGSSGSGKGEARQKGRDRPSDVANALTFGAGDNSLSDRGAQGGKGLIFPEDAELQAMDDEKLDNLLDSLLVRIVESLVEISSNSYEVQEQLNTPDKSGFTLLHYASLYNLQSLIPVLLSRGASPDTPTVQGKLTPLHLACSAGHFAIVEILVRNGCAVEVCDSFGSFPADHAARNGFPRISEWLRETSGGDKSQREDNRAAEEMRQNEYMDIENGPSDQSDDKGSLAEQGTGELGHEGRSSPMPPGVDPENEKFLLQAAFSNLSLKDKLAINLLVKKRQLALESTQSNNAIDALEALGESGKNIERAKNDPGSSPRSERGDGVASMEEETEGRENLAQSQPGRRHHYKKTNDLDVASVISESDKESLDIAMRLMNQEELDDIQNSSKDLDDDLRKWMLRRNYESLREASVHLENTLQSHFREQEKSFGATDGRKSVARGQNSSVRQTHAKRSLNNVKNQAIAGLVLRKNMARMHPSGAGGQGKTS